MTKWKKRLILSGIAAMLCAAILAGCGTSDSQTASKDTGGSAQSASVDAGSAEQAAEQQKKVEEQKKKEEQEQAAKIPKGDKYIALTFEGSLECPFCIFKIGQVLLEERVIVREKHCDFLKQLFCIRDDGEFGCVRKIRFVTHGCNSF